MSLVGLLSDRATIRRASDGTADTHGRPAKTWADLATGVPCRKTALSRRERGEEQFGQTRSEIAGCGIIFNAGQDVRATDHVVIDGVTHELVRVLPLSKARNGQAHHIECMARAIQ